MVPYPSAIGGSNVPQSPIANCERTVNYFIEQSQSGGTKSKAQLYPAPGVRTFVTTAGLNGRGTFEMDGRCFAVEGTILYELTDTPPTATVRGYVVADNHPATICSNGDGGGQLFITSGDNGYVFDLTTNTLSVVRVNGTSQGGMLDGFFLALDAETSTLYLSELLDGTTWDPLQFAQRSIAPDPWVAMMVNYREIWLFGEQTSEVWYNANTFPFPYAPHPSGLIPYGIAAPFSCRNIGGTLLWLARTADGVGQVVSASGFTPVVISTYALQVAIAGYSRIDDAIGDSLQLHGHTFYILTFPTEGATWVYDLTTKQWMEWLTWVSELNQYIAWRPLFHVVAFGGKHLIQDRAAGTIYELTPEVSQDVDGRAQRRLRRFPGLISNMERVFYNGLQVYLEPGLGLSVGQGSNPQLAMRISNDGGKSWGPERWQTAGAIGAYRTRAYWTRCGSARDRVFEISCTDPIPWRIVDAFLDVQKPERSA